MTDTVENAYYLVGIPEGEVLVEAYRLQREIADRYDMYRNPYPSLHMTLGVVFPRDSEELNKAARVLAWVMKEQPPFSITIENSSCFAAPHRSLHLQVADDPQLQHLSNRIQQALEENQVPCQDMADWLFHITLVNTLFAQREWSAEEFHEACDQMTKHPLSLTCEVRHLELWSGSFPPLKVAHQYDLRRESKSP